MPNAYEYARADGSPDWKGRTRDEDTFTDRVVDELRFHRGKGFVITDRQTGADGPVHRLNAIPAHLLHQLDEHPEMRVFEIRSESDGFALVARRNHVELDDAGRRVVEHELSKLGLPYLLGGSIPGPTDCSGLDGWAVGLEGVFIPHNAKMQHDLFRAGRAGFISISRSQIQRGDLIFHDDDRHVSTYHGDFHGIESVVDTEPHDTGAPAGWPKPNLGTGVQIRPMIGNYYCNWGDVTGVGRIVAINGKP